MNYVEMTLMCEACEKEDIDCRVACKNGVCELMRATKEAAHATNDNDR